jgi:hypothetical protein
METLLVEVNAYRKGSDHDKDIVINFTGTLPPSQFDSLYTKLMNEELTKDHNLALSQQEQLLIKQQLNDKVMKLNTTKAKAAAIEVTKQAKLAADAHKAKNIVALANAKKASTTALGQLHAILDPYERAMKDPKLVEVIKHSPDGQSVVNGLTALRQLKTHADGEDHVTQGRRFA